MTSNRYFLFTNEDKIRRVFHGSVAAAERAALRHLEPPVDGAESLDVTDQVVAAFELLEKSCEPEMVSIARTGRGKRGWVGGDALYAALCGAASERFRDFEPELEDWRPEYWGWRWEHVGISEDLVETTCDRIAELVFMPEDVARRVWSGVTVSGAFTSTS